MGIRFLCPNGHKLNVKAFQAGRRGICPFCGARFRIPTESTLPVGQSLPTDDTPGVFSAPTVAPSREGIEFEQELEAHIQRAEETVSEGASSGQRGSESAKPATPVESATSPAESNVAPRPNVAGPVATKALAADDGRPAEPQPSSATPFRATPAPDPLTEMPKAVWYVRPPSGGQFGPAQSGMLRNWLNEGRVSSETLVWREGWADWQEAGSVFPELKPASALPEAPPVAVGADENASSYRTGPRRRKSGPNIGLIVVLAAAVLLLLVVLILILILSGGAKDSGAGHGNSVAACKRWDGSVLTALPTQILS